MGCAEGVAHEDITKLRKAGTKGSDFLGVGFGRGAVFVFDFAFFFNVEAEIFEQDDFAGLERGAGGFYFGADAIVEAKDRAAEGTFNIVHQISGAHEAFNKTANI